MIEAVTSINYSLWCFIGCVPGFLWDLIQLITWLRKPAAKTRKGAWHMPFRESHSRLFVLYLLLNTVLLVALPLGFWLAFHPPTVKIAGSSQPGTNPTPLPQNPVSKPQAPVSGPDVSKVHPTTTFLQLKGEKPQLKPKAVQSQTVEVGGSLTQTTGAPCSGNSVTGKVDNSGCQVGNVPPPYRKIEKSGRDAALDVLREASQGSRVYFIVVGGSQEIKDFEGEIEGLFTDADWTIAGRSFIGEMHVTVVGGDGPSSSQGEGLHCSSHSTSGQDALRAMRLAGYPCSEGFVPFMGSSADLVVQVGTRIAPPD